MYTEENEHGIVTEYEEEYAINRRDGSIVMDSERGEMVVLQDDDEKKVLRVTFIQLCTRILHSKFVHSAIAP